MKRLVSVSLMLAVASLLPGGVSNPTDAKASQAVSLELGLLVDVSGSIDGAEFALQRDGYVNAFNSAAIQNLIAAAPGGIAVSYIQWSGASQQAISVGWTHLTNAASASAFAAAIAAAPRAYSGLTAIGSAINFGVASAEGNAFVGAKKVLDVSGDGTSNDGPSVTAARDAAVLAGFTINGLAIGPASLLTYYTNNVIGGPGAFAIGVTSFTDLEAAIATKLFREITEALVPEPATIAQGGLALLCVGMYAGARRWRRRTA